MPKKVTSKVNKQTHFNAYNLIAKKRDGKTLTDEEIKWFINGLLTGDVAEYQMSALLMAIYLNGMTVKETAALTDAMLYSGETLTFKGKSVIDKHSTGGVGDKASFILGPIAAACGVKVPMMAGRGLGHTGGTVDKIESVKGFKTSLSLEQFKKQLQKEGIVLIGQTKDIAPADKVIYGLRDVTATVESIPLITASIMSKKLAEGANGIVMDIKTGNGAFMADIKDAKALAKSLRDTAKRFNKGMVTYITDMNQPLGNYIGNSLEIIESIETLKGNGPKDLTDVSVKLAGAMIYLAGKAKTIKEGEEKAQKSIDNGKALAVFKKLIKVQGGDDKVIEDYSRLPLAKTVTHYTASKSGYVTEIACKQMGLHCVALGGGRKKASDKVDMGVGFILKKKIGDKVEKGETLVEILHHKKQSSEVEEIMKSLKKDIKVSNIKPKKSKLIYEMKEV
ncbi:thymidine phosphorylase [Bacteriovorax sp. DB6_IX]|uniref:thymidine phosphorylase n=1 Tax=Bacteriovorax sp. DB6_IX TaxID=1353530 RepID=UPI000389DB3B|nr:thymidine phosphorylase [Bacteriovorax sp. DB6_IX]EQC50651.1 putative pyrimidine-nucleoside phosphorylase [Bacteriovorax sp. DB6_IX]